MTLLTLAVLISGLALLFAVAAFLKASKAVRIGYRVLGVVEVIRAVVNPMDATVCKTYQSVRKIVSATRNTQIMIAVSLDCTKTYVIKNPQAVQRDAEENPVGDPKPVDGFELSIESQSGNFGTVSKNEESGDWEFNAGDLSQGAATGVLLGKGMVEGVEATGRLQVTLEPGAPVETELTFQLDVKADGEAKPEGEGTKGGEKKTDGDGDQA